MYKYKKYNELKTQSELNEEERKKDIENIIQYYIFNLKYIIYVSTIRLSNIKKNLYNNFIKMIFYLCLLFNLIQILYFINKLDYDINYLFDINFYNNFFNYSIFEKYNLTFFK